jgi:hypothetical protein
VSASGWFLSYCNSQIVMIEEVNNNILQGCKAATAAAAAIRRIRRFFLKENPQPL